VNATPVNETTKEVLLMQYYVENRTVNSIVHQVPSVNSRGLSHRKASKATKACLAARIVAGDVTLTNPTVKLIAYAVGVSPAYVHRALRLSAEEREAVERGERPLIMPTAAVRTPADPVQRLAEIVAEIGVDAALGALAESEDRRVA
jgi:hypothetical protein